MKKYNTFNFKWALTGIVLPILVFLISCGGVFGFFTATANNIVNNSSTGIIRIKFDESTDHVVLSDEIEVSSTIIQPGQTINISGGVENIGNADIYAIIKVSITIFGQGTHIEYFTANGEKIVIVDGNSITSATSIAKDASVNFDLQFELGFYEFDNSYMGKSIDVSYQARAIQQSGLSDGIEASNLLIN